jgi:hypothetical protein
MQGSFKPQRNSNQIGSNENSLTNSNIENTGAAGGIGGNGNEYQDDMNVLDFAPKRGATGQFGRHGSTVVDSDGSANKKWDKKTKKSISISTS